MKNVSSLGEQNVKHAQIARPVIYVIRAGTFCKIGISRNMRSRLGDYQIHCPLPVSVAFTTDAPDVAALERAVHQSLILHRAHGEWLRVSPLHAKRAIIAEKKRLWPDAPRSDLDYRATYERLMGGPLKRNCTPVEATP